MEVLRRPSMASSNYERPILERVYSLDQRSDMTLSTVETLTPSSASVSTVVSSSLMFVDNKLLHSAVREENVPRVRRFFDAGESESEVSAGVTRPRTPTAIINQPASLPTNERCV